ncbi:rhomboid family intramembrane serine protease [Anabaena cylindrica FACHB-243]|nr:MULTISPECIES: rhomboid family intramembrane serine protease [Anabaena]MBD2417947.1 rhomboid family intramembrane serine protease [Anabaena cylindrica FACHB-243]MBY5285522.1 rhomboid family intramembrane serine protease [Anabaena sp. CCAP 1446/1C]MBY5307027.1 rhomboid family intramembrane serine protease [Anabaena sp. CCAP 1446/1C]MCM2404863.1 rhomboid family intramembrane serine protease [Anabaena sp. CCAP 1446/1C]
MIPISDNIYSWKKPMITYWLIGVNLFIFSWQLSLDINDKLGSFVNTWGIIPEQINTAFTNAIFYNSAAWIVVFWRLFSLPLSLFLHSSFSQLLGNLLFLWVFGKSLERILGQQRYLLLYLVAGIFAGMIQIFMEPKLTIPVIGANGAIASILGAYIMKFPKTKIDSILPLIIVFIPVEIPAFFYLFWWFVQQLFYGIGSLNIPGGVTNLGYWGQFAGLVTGAAFMRMVQRR